MADMKMPALPPISPGALAEGEDYTKTYMDAISKVSQALERRMNEPQTNLWDVAGAFLAPTRTGSFFENLGMASKVLGEQKRRESEREIPIAQMRAALEGQRYEMMNKQKAFGILANAMGMENPQQAEKELQSGGAGMVGLSTKFTPELYIAMSRFDPKIAETVKNAAAMDVDRFKAMTEASKMGIDLVKMEEQFGAPAVARWRQITGAGAGKPGAPGAGAPQTGVPTPPTSITPRDTIAQFLSEDFGLDKGRFSTTRTRDEQQALFDRWKAGEKGIYKPLNPADYPDRQVFHDTAIDVPTTVPESYMRRHGWYRPDPKGDPVHYEPIPSKGIPGAGEQKGAPATGQAPAGEGPQFGFVQTGPNTYKMNYSGRQITVPEGYSPEGVRTYLAKAAETEENIYKQTVETEAKPWNAKLEEIKRYDDLSTTQNLNRVDSILKLIKKNPNVTGLLQRADVQDVLSNYLTALGAAAQEGIKAGNFGQISLPVEKFLSTSELNKGQRAALAELTRHISNEFLAGMRANRGLLGVNPTDNDARLFQAAQVTPANLEDNIYSWAQSRRAEYETMNKMYKGYVEHRGKYGVKDPASYFTAKDSPYHSAVGYYADLLGRLQSNAPGMQ